MLTDKQRIQIDLHYSALFKLSRGQNIKEMLESHPLIKPDLDKYWLTGVVYNKARQIISNLSCWYMWIEDSQNKLKADEYLNSYLNNQYVRTTFNVWVYGIKPIKGFRFDDISIVPIRDMPESKEQLQYLDLIERFESPVAHCAFTKDQDIPRIVECGKETTENHRQFVHKTFTELCDTALLVNGLHDLSCLPHWQCSAQSPLIPFGPWTPSGRSNVCFDIVGVHSREFSESHGGELHEMINYYKALQSNQKTWLNTILDRVRKSKRQQSIENKILDLCIAAEMLLLKDLTERDPVSFPFRFRGSWLLGKDYDDRKNIYDTLNKFYGYRCAIAHEGTFKKITDIRDAQRMLPEFYSIVEKVLKHAIQSTYPRKSAEWLELVLGKK